MSKSAEFGAHILHAMHEATTAVRLVDGELVVTAGEVRSSEASLP